MDEKKKYVIFWERMANSGKIELLARSHADAINNLGMNPDFVKVSCYEIIGNCVSIGKCN